MKRLVALLMCAVSLGASAQVTYPYNPDEDGNGQIAVGDLQGILATYGNEFSPSEILVDGETLTTVLTQLQNSIDSLSGLTGGGGSVLDMPLGTILPIATESVPEGWMLCDGREISIEEYQGLYDLIGTIYGAGDSAFWAQVFFPATTFNIPDLRGRTIIGADDMGGEPSEVLLEHGGELGETGGAEMHQLSLEESPHGELNVVLMEGSGWPKACNSCTGTSISSQTISNGGGDQPHNNMQPYMALNYMMKVQTAEDVFQLLENQISNLQGQLDSLSQSPPSYELGQFQGHGCSATSPSGGAGGQIMFCDVVDSIFVPSGYFFELTIGYHLSFSGYGRSAKCELFVSDDNGGPVSGVFRASDGATGISSSISRNFQLPSQSTATSSHSTSGNFSFRFVSTSDTTLVLTRQVSGNTINYAYCTGNNCGGVSGSMTMAYELYKP
ncbi:MAG: phage tail protein [Flavobacteriales bacterium]